jgi:hypothetical protein
MAKIKAMILEMKGNTEFSSGRILLIGDPFVCSMYDNMIQYYYQLPVLYD